MNSLLAIIFYLIGMFVTFCGILLEIYFKPSEKEEWGDVYSFVVFIMIIMWPVTIILTIANLIISPFKYIIGICFDRLDKVINYIGKKGELRKIKEKLSKNINESAYYESENSK